MTTFAHARRTVKTFAILFNGKPSVPATFAAGLVEAEPVPFVSVAPNGLARLTPRAQAEDHARRARNDAARLLPNDVPDWDSRQRAHMAGLNAGERHLEPSRIQLVSWHPRLAVAFWEAYVIGYAAEENARQELLDQWADEACFASTGRHVADGPEWEC
jgi:hypothetical protein